MPIDQDEFTSNLARVFERFAEELDESTDLLKMANKAGDEAREEANKRNKEIYEKQLKWINKTSDAALDMVKTFSTGSGSFDGLATTISGLGTSISKVAGTIASKIPVIAGVAGAIEAFGKAATAGTTFIIQTYEKFYSEFEKVSQVGVVATTEDLKSAMYFTRMNFTDTSKVLGKYSKELAYFGGSALAGRQSFERMSAESSVFTDDLQKLGIGITEWNETQIRYVDRLARTGNLAGKSNVEVAKGAREYQLELDKLSKITGLTRQDLLKEREDRMSDARYRAGISTLDEPIQRGIDSFLDQVKALAPGMKTGIQDLIASGGVPVTEEAKAALIALQQGGMNVQEFIDRLRKGQVGGVKAMAEVITTSKGAANSFQNLTKYVGADTIATKYQVDLMNLMNSGLLSEVEIEKKVKELQAKTLADKESENSALAGTRRNLYELQTTLQLMTLDVKSVSTAMEELTEVMYTGMSALSKFTGVDVPEMQKLHRKQHELNKKEYAIKSEIEKLEERKKEALASGPGPLGRLRNPQGGKTKVERLEESLQEKRNELASVPSERSAIKDEIRVQLAADMKRRGISEAGPGAIASRAQEVLSGQAAGSSTAGPGREVLSGQAAGSSTAGPGRGAGPEAGIVGAEGGMTIEQLNKEGLKLRGYGDVHLEGAPLSPNLITLAKKIQNEPGFQYFSGLNDKYHQRFASNHNKGLAMDFVIDENVATDAKQVAAIIKRLQEMGAVNIRNELVRPAGSSNWSAPHIHAEVPKFADGGIVNSPTLGLIGEAGPEAVVPLSEDGIFDRMSSKLDRLISVNNMSALSSKLDSLISVTERQNSLLSGVFDRLT